MQLFPDNLGAALDVLITSVELLLAAAVITLHRRLNIDWTMQTSGSLSWHRSEHSAVSLVCIGATCCCGCFAAFSIMSVLFLFTLIAVYLLNLNL